MNNFKKLEILKEENLPHISKRPFHFCTFSRVMKEKGIEDAVNTVKRINDEMGRIECSLDIYGQVDENQISWFENLKRDFPNYISYKGSIPYDKSVEVIKSYYAVLFPTKYYTEGIPGTVLDAYAAGVPVICSKWESFGDVVDDDKTGWGDDFFDENGLYNAIVKILKMNQTRYFEIKKNCLRKAYFYKPENGIYPLLDRIL